MKVLDLFSFGKDKKEGEAKPDPMPEGLPVAEPLLLTYKELDRLDSRRVRRRWMWRLGAVLGLAALVAGIGTMLSPSSPVNIGSGHELKIDKEQIGKILPVAGALPGASSTGHVAVIKIDGEIDGDILGEPSDDNTALYIATALAKAEEDDDLAGVIVYINSPGGDSAASAQGYRLLSEASERLAKRHVPVIAYTSKGMYSGGYYIALGAPKIYADPDADVANIGVIMRLYNTAGLGDLLGIHEDIVASGPLKNTGGQWEHMSPGSRAMLDRSLQLSFRHYLEAVAKSRGIDLETLIAESQTADGRTNGGWFLAEDAKEKKLIDDVVPVEDLFAKVAGEMPVAMQKKYKGVEFENYKKKLSFSEEIKKRTSRSFDAIFSEARKKIFSSQSAIRAE